MKTSDSTTEDTERNYGVEKRRKVLFLPKASVCSVISVVK